MDVKFQRMMQLMKTQDNKQFVLQIVRFLDEPKIYIVRSIVNLLDRKTIYSLLQQTYEIQMNGGMAKTITTMQDCADAKKEKLRLQQELNGDKSEENKSTKSFDIDTGNDDMKTAGGVFMTLLKKQVPKDLQKKIFKAEKMKQQEKKQMINLTKRLELSCQNPENMDQQEAIENGSSGNTLGSSAETTPITASIQNVEQVVRHQGIQGEGNAQNKINSPCVQNQFNGIPNLSFPPSSGLDEQQDQMDLKISHKEQKLENSERADKLQKLSQIICNSSENQKNDYQMN